MLQRQGGERSKPCFIVYEAIQASSTLAEWKVFHTRREGNCAAHKLTQLALRAKHSVVWWFSVLPCIEHIIGLLLGTVITVVSNKKASLFLGKKKWTLNIGHKFVMPRKLNLFHLFSPFIKDPQRQLFRLI
jgi:hypothetical protein